MDRRIAKGNSDDPSQRKNLGRYASARFAVAFAVAPYGAFTQARADKLRRSASARPVKTTMILENSNDKKPSDQTLAEINIVLASMSHVLDAGRTITTDHFASNPDRLLAERRTLAALTHTPALPPPTLNRFLEEANSKSRGPSREGDPPVKKEAKAGSTPAVLLHDDNLPRDGPSMLKCRSLVLADRELTIIHLRTLGACAWRGYTAKLTVLDLSGNGLTDAAILALAEGLGGRKDLPHGAMPNLEVLTLSDNHIGPRGMQALVYSCSPHVLQRVAERKRGPVSQAHANRLEDLSGDLGKLEKLFLANNRIGDAGTAQLALAITIASEISGLRTDKPKAHHKAIFMHRLTHLDISSNFVGEPGCSCLFEALGSPMTCGDCLQELILSHNHIRCDGAMAVSNAIVPKARKVLQLHHGIPEASIDALLGTQVSWMPLHRLETFELDQNEMSNRGIAYIGNALKNGALPRLFSLSVAVNTADEDSTKSSERYNIYDAVKDREGLCGRVYAYAARSEAPAAHKVAPPVPEAWRESISTKDMRGANKDNLFEAELSWNVAHHVASGAMDAYAHPFQEASSIRKGGRRG